jgi:hypothetical protein
MDSNNFDEIASKNKKKMNILQHSRCIERSKKTIGVGREEMTIEMEITSLFTFCDS